MEQSLRLDVFCHMLADLGTPIRPGMKLLDFGCGEGVTVKAALAQGIDAWGCDLGRREAVWNSLNVSVNGVRLRDRLRLIRTNPYRLPFDDSIFDVVISQEVFEHVQNYAETIDELHRILRPGGVCLHSFPSRYRLIEGHVYVPFASMFRPRWWLWLWALLGVRNPFQHGLPPSEVVKRNAEYLPQSTNYLPPGRIRREFARRFGKVEFVERLFLPYSGRAKVFLHVPGGAAIYGLFFSRFIYGMRDPVLDAAPSRQPEPQELYSRPLS
jgi:SAM-dependent methyltransferase